MKRRVADYTEACYRAMERGRDLVVYAILRIQHRAERSVSAANGAIQSAHCDERSGMGVQVITPDGATGHACTDRITPEAAERLVEDAARLASMSQGYGARKVDGHQRMPRLITSVHCEAPMGIENFSHEEEQRLVAKASAETAAIDPALACHTAYGIVHEEWRVVRSDGTDVMFNMPRAVCRSSITARDASSGRAASVGAAVSGRDASIIATPEGWERFMKRSRTQARTALALLEARGVKAGSYRLVIDYALAKGLAHEAFGHSAESDGMRTSILWRDGKFMAGTRVAPPNVSIVDGPVEGDYAYQPVSSNGVLRGTVHIVRDGVLTSALADAFSAAEAGVEPTGAGRAESYRDVPLPRMSNIRLTVADPIPMPRDFEDVTPEHVRDALVGAGLLQEGQVVLYLSGYKGGQVNPAKGDFVFNCSAIYELTTSAIRLRLPAIFSGKVLSALAAILAGIGDPVIDAQGTCGKKGQGVPSSGGANMFLVIDAAPDIRIGGV